MSQLECDGPQEHEKELEISCIGCRNRLLSLQVGGVSSCCVHRTRDGEGLVPISNPGRTVCSKRESL
jgi:hypothetical protein